MLIRTSFVSLWSILEKCRPIVSAFLWSDVKKVCMELLTNGVFGLAHILFVAHSTDDQVGEVQAFTVYFKLAR